MIPIPAIDIKDGAVVRLLHGEFSEKTIYDVSPTEVAERYAGEGAKRIHVVDLDGALHGEPKNFGTVEALLRKVAVPVEVGGGIRSLRTAAHYFEIGAAFVILGTKACLDKGFMAEAVKEFEDKIIIGIDARDGFVAVDGWTKVTQTRATELAQQAESIGAQTVIYTDISKDGALKGPNVDGIRKFCHAVKCEVIGSGGIAELEDLAELKKLGLKNLSGIVIGKALYEKNFTLKEAIQLCSASA